MKITKPIDNTNNYKLTTLENGIDVMVITSDKVLNTSVSLTINVGYYQDTIPGMAHFLEHMLFMGTKKYPEEGYFQKFIIDNGGHTNAFTINQYTSYYYDIDTKLFKDSIDIFADFFINPSFNLSAINREINAIDEEHNKNINNPQWRLNALLREVSNLGERFGTGSSKTLNIPDIRTKVADFFNNYYSGNIIKVSILSPLNLNYLKEILKNSIALIPNKRVLISKMPDIIVPNKMIYYDSIDDQNKCNICWAIKSIDTPLLGYLLHILNNPLGLNSIANIQCYFIDSDDNTKLLTVEISNYENTNDILNKIYTYFDTILPKIISDRRYFDEYMKIMNINFEYGTISDYPDHNSTINMNMFKYKDVIKDSYIADYSKDYFENLLNDLSFTKAIMLMAISDRRHHNKREKWYGIKYSIGDMPKLSLINNKYTLPKFNKYIPTTFTIYNKETSTLDYKNNIWQRSYKSTRLVAVVITFRIKQSVSAKLLQIIIEERIKLLVYYINSYNCDISVTASVYGMQLFIKSYPDKLSEILKSFKTSLTNQPDNKELDYAKKMLLRDINDHDYHETIDLLYESLSQSFLEIYHNVKYFKDNLDKYEHFDILKYPIEILCEGNINEKVISDIERVFKNIQPYNDAVDNKLFYLDESCTLINVYNYNHDINSGIMVFYELPISDNIESSAYALLCETMLKQSFFKQLRTIEQLGYTIKVHFIYETLNGYILPGICFAIISANNNILYVRKRISEFVKSFKFSENDFNKYKQALINKLSRNQNDPISNAEANSSLILTNSHKMANSEVIFDIDRIIMNHVKEIKYNNAVTFFDKYFIRKTKRVRVFQINRNIK